MQNTDPEKIASTIVVTTGLGAPALGIMTEYVSANAVAIGLTITVISIICQIYFSIRNLNINQRRFDIEDREKKATLRESELEERERILNEK